MCSDRGGQRGGVEAQNDGGGVVQNHWQNKEA